MNIKKIIAENVESGKEMILDDICNSVVPSNIKTFSELHDYVDANEYVIPALELDFETLVEVADRTSKILDEWIKNGMAA